MWDCKGVSKGHLELMIPGFGFGPVHGHELRATLFRVAGLAGRVQRLGFSMVDMLRNTT